MQQIRLYTKLAKDFAQDYFNKLEQNLAEEYYPIAIVEETEISVYCYDYEETKVKQRLIDSAKNFDININKEILPNIDWVEHSLKGLSPVETNKFFIYGSHDKNLIKANKLNIEINANQAFGTGHHYTTMGCLELLAENLNNTTNNILDIGTGSGILSIAMAKLQEQNNIKCNIIASDIDSVAIKVAKENFILNNVEQYINSVVASGINDKKIINKQPFDIIVANILAKPLIELANDIKNIVHMNSIIILSGILDNQSDDVINAYVKQNFAVKQKLCKNNWVALSFSTN